MNRTQYGVEVITLCCLPVLFSAAARPVHDECEHYSKHQQSEVIELQPRPVSVDAENFECTKSRYNP